MVKRAIFVIREATGVAAFGKRLVDEFGFELLGNDRAMEAFAAKGMECSQVSEVEVPQTLADKDFGVRLLIANFADVAAAGRAFMSWKSALAAFDRAIVDGIRAAAWAVDRVAVLGNPADYDAALAELKKGNGKFSQSFRMERATAALRAASEFDFAVAEYLEVQGADAPDMGALSGFGKAMRFAWPRAQLLDTGENRHQRAGLYGDFWSHFRQVSGETLDYESVLSVSKAAYLIGEFEKPAAVLMRKGKIVTAACSSELVKALDRVVKHEAIRGSWLVVNSSIGVERLDTISASGVAGVLAPDFSEEEEALLKSKKGLRGLAATSGLGYEALLEVRSVVGGALVQDKDRGAVNPMEWTVQSFAQPLVDDWETLMFGAKLVRHVDSSGLVILSDERVVELEVGHYSVERAWQAILECGIGLANTIAVFDDPEVAPETLRQMKEQGVRAVLLPLGEKEASWKDAANEVGLVLLTMGKSMRRL